MFYINSHGYDDDTINYINAVEDADNQVLEPATREAYHRFIVGCKDDGIWDAIKASCILVGARTLAGALTPLVGTAPTNFNFVEEDYNRKTGLKGDASTKYLNTFRAGSADPQNNKHMAIWISEATTAPGGIIGDSISSTGSTNIGQGSSGPFFRNQTNNATIRNVSPYITGFTGTSRNVAANYTHRFNGNTTEVNDTSQTPSTAMTYVFGRTGAETDSRLSFYSFGESLTLSLLDTRVSQLMTDINNAF